MSEVASKRFYPKNAFGLPSKDSEASGRSFYSEEEESETPEQEAPVEASEEEVEREDVSSQEEEGEEQDLTPESIAAALDTDEEETTGATEEDPQKSLQSELDRLRRERDIYEARLNERKEMADSQIKEKGASITQESADQEEEEADSYINWGDPRIQEKAEQIVREDPGKLPLLMKAIVAEEQKRASKEIEPIKKYVEQAQQYRKQVDVARQLATNVDEGLNEASGLGEYEQAIVQHARNLAKEGRGQDTRLAKELAKNPELVKTKEGVISVVVRLARQAREKASQAEAEGRPVVRKAVMAESGKATDRSKLLSKSEKPTPEDENKQIFESIKNAGTREDGLAALFKR